MVKFLLWLAPFLIVPASYLFFRYVPFRRPRYCFYGLILVAAFFLNLFLISFWNEILDTIEFLVINFICAEFFWNALRMKRRKFFRILFTAALCLYGFELRSWIAGGPNHAWELWKPYTAGTYRCGSGLYAVRERSLFAAHQARLLVLTKKTGILPFEKQIGTYRTPEGFKYTDFIYTWSETAQGVRLDISTVGYKLWTLGEGF
ncbi:MAG: hypothetical protein ABSF80_06420 [Chitinispirillaceae bacterium]|jgi:hypothetical protein